MYDLVIDHALVIDGLDGAPVAGGVAVQDGRIAALGRDLGPACERVDARGLVLAPGIVDIHTHYDAQLTWDPFATPSTALGVTTVKLFNTDEDEVRKLLRHPRGRIVPGAWADLMLFDPQTVARGAKRKERSQNETRTM